MNIDEVNDLILGIKKCQYTLEKCKKSIYDGTMELTKIVDKVLILEWIKEFGDTDNLEIPNREEQEEKCLTDVEFQASSHTTNWEPSYYFSIMSHDYLTNQEKKKIDKVCRSVEKKFDKMIKVKCEKF